VRPFRLPPWLLLCYDAPKLTSELTSRLSLPIVRTRRSDARRHAPCQARLSGRRRSSLFLPFRPRSAVSIPPRPSSSQGQGLPFDDEHVECLPRSNVPREREDDPSALATRPTRPARQGCPGQLTYPTGPPRHDRLADRPDARARAHACCSRSPPSQTRLAPGRPRDCARNP
jgi:hypothetical protein